MKGAKYVLIAGLALIAAGKIADAVQKKQDDKKNSAIAAISQKTTSKAIANAKPLVGSDPPLKVGDTLAKQYNQDIYRFLESRDAGIARECITHLNMSAWKPEDDTYGKTGADSLNIVTRLLEQQLKYLKLLKSTDDRMIKTCKALLAKYGDYQPEGTGMGLKAILKFYNEQATGISAALDKTGKALEQAANGKIEEKDWLYSGDWLDVTNGKVWIASISCM